MSDGGRTPGRTDAAPPESAPWHTLAADAVERELRTGPHGLSTDEAARRLVRYGPNEVETERETPWWTLLLHQFRDPLIYILLIAAAVTLVLRDFTDTGIILAVVVLNAIIGFIQEFRAQQAMRALARLSAPRAEVVRGGEPREVASREVVPGDVVVLTSGVRVPADVRLTRVRDLEVDESALTGESATVRKATDPLERETLVPGDQVNMAFAGTVVTRGRARGIVVRTADATELGRIATAVRRIGQTATPLQQKVGRLGTRIGIAIGALSLVIAAIGLLQAMAPADIFLAAVALAVSAIPEGLPVVLTVTLAVGVRRMAAREAIIRSLPAVETLGSTTVIGSDKTGTLTENEMTVRAIWTGGRGYGVTGAGYGLEGTVERGGAAVTAVEHAAVHRTLLAGTLANEADAGSVEAGRPAGDPTELALHVAAAKGGVRPTDARREHAEIDLLPFEPERRFMATLNRGPGGDCVYVKGAPEAVLARCDAQVSPAGGPAPLDADAVRAAADELAADGLRVLAMAYRCGDGLRLDPDTLGGGLIFAGLQGMEDPVRPEALTAVRAAGEAGIRVLMLTGDHVETAAAIGRQLGLDPQRRGAVEGHVLDTLSDEELAGLARAMNVYARVAPEHKLRIVEHLKQRDEIVAVTGDGVNDAPALRAAHLGVAMGRSGTDVAREASDMVLADDSFATITNAVEEGRIVFSNIRKVTFFLLSTGVGEVFTIIAALLAGWPLPLLAAQILWINLVTNGLQDVALAFEPGEPGLLHQPPRPPREGILTHRILERLGGVGAVLAAGTLGVFWWALTGTGDLDHARTVAMTQMVVFQFFHVFNSRSLDRSILRIPLLSNRFLFVSILLAALAHLGVLYVPALQTLFRTGPLTTTEWSLVLAVGTTVIFGGELDKWLNRRRQRPLG